MSEPTVYELLAKHIDQGFARLDARADQILEYQALQNGRLKDAEIRLAVHQAMLDAGAKRIDAIHARSHDTANKVQVLAGGVSGSVRKVLARDASLVVATVSLCIAALKMMGALP